MKSDPTRKIGDIAEIFDGPHATPKKTKKGPYFLNISSLEKGQLDLSRSAHLSEQDFVKWTKRVTPKPGDLLFSYETRLGEAALMPDGIRACLGRRMGLLRPDRKQVLPQYLLYAYLSPAFQKIIKNNTIRGATVDRIAITDLVGFPIRIPPLKEQTAISGLLQAIDQKIELNQRISAELEAMAKTLYEYWFVQFDFPDAQGRPYRHSGGAMVWNEALGREIPAGWEAANILQVAELMGGGTPSKRKSEYWGGTIPFFTPSDTTSGVYVLTTESHITQTGLQNSSTYLFKQNTVFITARGSVGRLALAAVPMAMNQSCYALQAKEGVGTAYLYFLTRQLIRHLEVKASGSVFNSIVSNDIKHTLLAIPKESNLITAYTQTTRSIFEKIRAAAIESNHLASLRDWLLPMLMNGQVRVATPATQEVAHA